MAKIGWYGFDGRMFLTDVEHATYCRRLPVRYAAKGAGPKPKICDICGRPSELKNSLQAAHRIPFNLGVIRYRLTPEWLDRPENLVWAHRQICNKKAEFSSTQIEAMLACFDLSGGRMNISLNIIHEPRG